MTNQRRYSKLVEDLSLSPISTYEKSRLIRDNFFLLLNKTSQMFDYDNLPYSLPKMSLELYLQLEGSCVIWSPSPSYVPIGFGPSFDFKSLLSRQNDTSSQSSIYAFSTSFADAPDPYHSPYKVVVTSPGFRPTISETLEINKDCIVFRNDTHMYGLRRLHAKYAALLTEAEISLNSTLIVLRDQMTFIAKTEPQRAAVAKYLQDREDGKIGAILAPGLGTPLEALATPSSSTSNAVELAVNGRQAIYAAWYNEMGLNPSFSLKREYTSAEEIGANTELLMPTIDDMYECRVRACEQINAMFGTNISVRKSSAWKQKDKETENAMLLEEANINLLEAQAASEVYLVDNDNMKEGESNGDSDSVPTDGEPDT